MAKIPSNRFDGVTGEDFGSDPIQRFDMVTAEDSGVGILFNGSTW
jgi:hypothetical protein